MRIVLDCRCAFEGMGGIGRYAWSLLLEFLAMDVSHEVVAYFTRRPPPAPIPASRRLSVRLFDAGMVDERFDHLVLPGLLEEDEADVYHNPTFAAPAIRSSAAVVSTVHDVVFARRPELVEPGLRVYLDAATRRACRNADRIVTVSEFSRREIAAAYSVSGDRIEVIPNGVGSLPELDTPGGGRAARGGDPWPVPGPFVLYVGSIEPKKNLRVLVEGFARAMAEPDCRPASLVLAGSGSGECDLLANLAERLGVGSSLKMLGYVPDRTLESLYRNALAFIYPSHYEGFGLPPLEAMARGVPTIVADAASLPEVVGDAALRFPPDDPAALATLIARLMQDAPLRDGLRERGRARAAGFTWRRSAEAHLRVYEGVGRASRKTVSVRY